MRALIVRDLCPSQSILAVDLRFVLDALGPRVFTSTWRVRNVWALGNSASELEACGEQEAVAGTRLAELAHGVYQVIDGLFCGFDAGASFCWVVVQAVDSSFYLVHSDDPAVLDTIRQTFHDVSDGASEF